MDGSILGSERITADDLCVAAGKPESAVAVEKRIALAAGAGRIDAIC